ncbi:MAG: carotenoid biosynthesis protein [Clostridiales bacterium]|nr:carotenoid biosynthesis protein [Clostridiales bacterium]
MIKDYRIPGFVEKHLQKMLVMAAIFYLVITLIIHFAKNYPMFRVIASVGLAVFVIFHGTYRYRWESMIVFITLAFIISWGMETLSIKTGVPFGNYHYTNLLGAKAGVVPWGIMFAYFFTGYISWTMSTIFFREYGTGISKKRIILIPLLASLIMIIWNISFEPIMSTIEGNWVWVNGGRFFGVPLTNFFGWYITSYLIFQIFALFNYKTKGNELFTPKKSYWVLVPMVFIVQGLEYLINPFVKTENLEIYWFSFVTTLLLLVGVSLLCMFFIFKKK